MKISDLQQYAKNMQNMQKNVDESYTLEPEEPNEKAYIL